MAAPILYSCRRCPYAMRARLALRASGTEVELRDIALKDKPAALLQASPKATVPVLVLATGEVLEQSLDIMLWALHANDPQGWLPADGTALDETLACIATNDGPFKQALDRYKYPHRFGLADGQTAREQGAAYLQQWDARLQAKGFLNGDQWGLLDAAIAPFVRQFAHTDFIWFSAQPWPYLARWLSDFESSASFAAVMEKTALWAPEAEPHITRFASQPPVPAAS